MSTSLERAIRGSIMQFPHPGAAAAGRGGEVIGAPRLGDIEALAPMLAGARARGVADAFELLGMPAVLIDQSGTVLHVGASAMKLLGGDIAVVSRHLVGAAASTNRALQNLIAAALSGEDEVVANPVFIAREGLAPLTVRAIRIPGASGDPMQLLKAIIVLGEAELAPPTAGPAGEWTVPA